MKKKTRFLQFTFITLLCIAFSIVLMAVSVSAAEGIPISVTDGTADPTAAITGDTVTVTADTVEGKTFKEWQVVSGGVTLADETAATTTFTVGTEAVELIAVYDYVDYTVSIKDGKGYVNHTADQITNAHVGDTVQISADDPDEGYYFVGWSVLSGEATLADSSADTTTFTMTAGDVELEAVYAEITYLTEIKFTVTPPAVGDLAESVTLIPAEPEKYGYTLEEIYSYDSGYPTLATTDAFKSGTQYAVRFEVVCAKGYALASDAVTTVNGDTTSCYSGVEDREWNFEFPTALTVTGGKAYTSNTYETEIGEVFAGDYIYLKADEAPEGKMFLYWRITIGENTSYDYYNTTYIYVYSSYKVITCEAIYVTPIESVEGTIPAIKVGDTPITTVTDESDLYDIYIEGWYYYDSEYNKIEMLPTDTYQANVQYECEFRVEPIDGYGIAGDITINGRSINVSGWSAGTAIRYGYLYYYDTAYVTVTVTGGKIWVDGVETTDSQFLPGTVLTLVADAPEEGMAFRKWNTPYVYATVLGVTDYRVSTLTFTVGVPWGFDHEIVFESVYSTPQALYYLYTDVPHPTVGGNPSYSAGLDAYDNYYGEVLGWYEGETLLDPTHVFEVGKSYTVRVKLTPAAGYYFAEAIACTFRNYFSDNQVDGTLVEYEESGAYIVVEFTALAKSYQASASVTVTAPVAGKAPDETVTKGADTYCDVTFDGWMVYDTETSSWRDMTDGELFEVGKQYRAFVEFTSNETHYVRWSQTAVLINGVEAEGWSNGTNASGYTTTTKYIEFTVAAGENYGIAVENGSASVDATPVTTVGGGITVTITADAPAEGKAFKEWIVVSGENVFLVDATAATTTFVMPAGDVKLQAVYRNTPHDITVTDGTADLTFAGSGETITITANEAPDGKYFAGWECISGGVTFADATAKTTTFVMTGEEVTVKVIWADKTYLEEVIFTTTKPANGEKPATSITSADPEKYTATLEYWYNNSANAEMGAEETFAYGIQYGLNFYIAIDEKYYIDGDTVVKINGYTTGYYSGTPGYLRRYENGLYVPVPITVEGGKAYTSNTFETEINEMEPYNYVYLKADVPAGKRFAGWEVVRGGVSISYANYAERAYFYLSTSITEPVVIRAVYDMPTVTVTDGKIYVGGEEIENGAQIPIGTTVTVVANTAPEGKYFGYWSYSGGIALADSYAATTTFTMESSNASLSVSWRTSPSVTVTGGKLFVDGVEVASGSKIAPGTVVKIVANAPDEGKYFSGWSGNTSLLADSKATETTFTMGTVNVSFSATYYECSTVTVTGGKLFVDGVEVASGSKIAPGTVVKIVANAPDEGKYFSGWSGNTSLLADSKATETTFTMGTNNVSFTANYKSYTAYPSDYFYLDFLIPYTGGKPVDGNQDGAYSQSTFTVIGYYDGTTKLTSADTFVQGKSYTVELRIVPKTGYYFDTAKTYRIEQYYDGTRAEIVSLSANEILCRFTFVALTPITEVNVSFTLPVSGEQASFVATLPKESPYTVNDFEWKIGDTWYESDYTAIFENGETCRAWIQLLPKEGYTFSPYVEINLTFPAGYVADSDDMEVYGTECYINADYVCAPNPSKATVSVTDGGAYVYEADDPSAEEPIGTRLYLFANDPADGKVFLKWEIVSGNAVIDNPYAAKTNFLLTENTVIKATYTDDIERAITVTGGTADKTVAKAGETVTLTAATAPEGKYFHGWIVKSGGATLADAWETETTFIMTGEAVEIEAVFLDPITEIVLKADANKPVVGATAAPFTVYSVNGSTELAYLIDIWAGWYKFPTAEVDWGSDYVNVGTAPIFAEGYYAVYFETWSEVGIVRYDENCKLILKFNDGEVEAVIEDIGSSLSWIDYNALFALSHTHTAKTEWKSDADNHWHECVGCEGQQLNKAAHTDTDTNGKCDTCGADVPVPPPAHTHDYGTTWKSDENNHWKECECEEKSEVGAHVDNNGDNKCDTCNYTMPAHDPDTEHGTEPGTTPGTDDPNTPDDPDKKDGLGAGAIVGIVVGSVAVAGVGGFALFWFVIKKKSWADLLAVFKKK